MYLPSEPQAIQLMSAVHAQIKLHRNRCTVCSMHEMNSYTCMPLIITSHLFHSMSLTALLCGHTAVRVTHVRDVMLNGADSQRLYNVHEPTKSGEHTPLGPDRSVVTNRWGTSLALSCQMCMGNFACTSRQAACILPDTRLTTLIQPLID